PFAEPGAVVPAAPSLTRELLAGATDTAGFAALAKAALGVDLPADESFPERLGEVIDQYRTVSVVEQALAWPAPLHAAADALAALPERAGASTDACLLEAQAVVLLGAAARVPATGEDEPQPRFRPRVHQVLRSLAGLWRCTKPSHGALRRPARSRC